jgi:hypothetical protein
MVPKLILLITALTLSQPGVHSTCCSKHAFVPSLSAFPRRMRREVACSSRSIVCEDGAKAQAGVKTYMPIFPTPTKHEEKRKLDIMVMPSDAPNLPANSIIEWSEDSGCDAWALFIPDAADTQSELAVLEGNMQRLKTQVIT